MLPVLGLRGGFRRFSVAEYGRLAEVGILTEDDRLELIEGYLVNKMTVNPPHAGTVRRLERLLQRLLPPDWDCRTQSPLVLPDSVPEPDLAVVVFDADDYRTRHPTAADAALVVEVSDSSLEGDRGDKVRIYARAAISIYWIVNLADGQVEV
jgi:Uma2 family endonuclease